MTCTCPKCAAPIELDASQLGETGTAIKCPSCKARLQVSREPFVRRAYRKATDISCAHCGGQLGHYLNCPSCGLLYPDYYVAETPDAVRKRTRKVSSTFRAFKNISFEWRSTTPIKKMQTYRPAVVAGTTAAPSASVERTRQTLVRVVGLIVIVAVLVGGYLFYSHSQSKRQFAANFVRAIYVIKTGTDLNLKICARVTADWRAKSGGPAPRITADEEAKLNKVRNEVDAVQKLLGEPPGSFQPAAEKLGKLKEVYLNLQNITMTPPNSLNLFVDSASKGESDFKKAAQELKGNLPAELTEALTKAKTDYKTLQDF